MVTVVCNQPQILLQGRWSRQPIKQGSGKNVRVTKGKTTTELKLEKCNRDIGGKVFIEEELEELLWQEVSTLLEVSKVDSV